MKISLKIFVFTYCIMMCITVVAGIILVSYIYRKDLNKAMKDALETNEMLYIYVSTLDGVVSDSYTEYSVMSLANNMSGTGEHDKRIFIGEYDEWSKKISLAGYDDLDYGQVVSNVIKEGDKTFIQVTSRCGNEYIINYYDITGILNQRDSNYRIYRQAIIICSMFIAVIMYIFSRYITRPLEDVTRLADNISRGDYSARMDASYKKMKSYEAAKLGETLNELAGNTESHITEIEEYARKNEDFVGSFTHELKTPMTSIIGYADLLRTYDLSPDKRREYSNYIYSEGKRLEQLSLNLLQLLVLGREEFDRQEVSMSIFGKELKDSVLLVGSKYDVRIDVDFEAAVLYLEPVLMTSAVTNVIDNACKASIQKDDVIVRGRRSEDGYRIEITDKGIGIPDDELDKIMEPFYMVDKSRARKQGGAGLGLALCAKIVSLHDGKMEVRSELGRGTMVSLIFPCTAALRDGGESDASA